MIGEPVQCCTIHTTGDTTLSIVRNYPSPIDTVIYSVVYIFAICYIFKRMEDKRRGW